MFLVLKIKIYKFNLRECWVTDLSNVHKGFDTTLYFVTILSVHIDAIVRKNNGVLSRSSRTKNQVMYFNDIFLRWQQSVSQSDFN